MISTRLRSPPNTPSRAGGHRALHMALLLTSAAAFTTWLVLSAGLDVRPEHVHHALRTPIVAHAAELPVVDEALRIQQLLARGDYNPASDTVDTDTFTVYPEEIFSVDWSTQVLRADVLHLGRLQRACAAQNDSILAWSYGRNASAPAASALQLTRNDHEELLVQMLRQCGTIDLYMPEGIRGQGYCEDAAVYAKYLRGRILPQWVFQRKFFDKSRNATVSYHELCPRTPLLVFNHYWDGLRSDAAFPPTKPLYLMPNIEMFELEAAHYLQADVILCKTVVCAQYLTKWFQQEGNPRLTQVLYTRFTSSDVATNALVASGVEADNETTQWSELPKNFSHVAFTHTAGTSLWKGTQHILDCWANRPDLPLLDVYIREDFYVRGYKKSYDRRISAAGNIALHLGKLDAASFGTMIAKSAFFLCTSVMEGYGHYINHARAAGGLVVTADAPPMNELVSPTSGVLVKASAKSWQQQFLGGSSPDKQGLKGVPGFVASFSGNDVCEAVDQIVNSMDSDSRRRRAVRVRQQFFYDTAFLARKMEQLRKTLRPAAEASIR